MRTLYLEGKNEIELEDRTVEVLYYLMEESRNGSRESAIYGIQIEKRDGKNIEIEKSGAISGSKEIVKQMLHKLVEYSVTPMTMLEIIDEMVTEELCG